MLFLGRQLFATLEQKLGPHQADAVDIGRIKHLKFGETRDIDHHLNRLAGGRQRRAMERSRRLPQLRLFVTTLTINSSRIAVGIDNEKSRVAVEQGIATVFEMIDVYPHDHRHAARSRENGDMAARASAAQYQAAVTPIIGQKHGRRHIVGRDDDAGRHGLIGFTRQMPQHAIAEVAQIGSTGAEIGIFRLIVGCDFRIDRRTPGPVGNLAFGNAREPRR